MLDSFSLIDSLTASTDRAFGQVSALMNDVRDGLGALCTLVEDLDAVLQNQRANSKAFGEVQAAAADLAAALSAASAVASSKETMEAGKTTSGLIADIFQQSRIIDAVAQLTLVTANSMNATGFESYVGDLRDLNSVLAADSASLDVAVSAVLNGRRRAARLFAMSQTSVGSIVRTLEDCSDRRARANGRFDDLLMATGTVAAQLPQINAQETGALVRAMQFSDAASQRMGHIRMILAQEEHEGRVLAGAQIIALREAMLEQATAIGTSLDCIGRVLRAAAGVLDSHGATGTQGAEEAVELGRTLLVSVVEISSQAMSQIEAAGREGRGLRETADEAMRLFGQMIGTIENIRLAAINASLLSKRDQGKERALAVLSQEVQQQAASCADASNACRGVIVKLARSEDLEAFATVVERGLMFSRRVEEANAGLRMASEALIEIGRLRDAARNKLDLLDGAIQAANEGMAAMRGAATELADFAATLPRNLPEGSDSLLDLMSIYTMEAEREVHRAVFGLPPEEAAKTGAQDDDPLAGVLF